MSVENSKCIKYCRTDQQKPHSGKLFQASENQGNNGEK